MGPLKSILENEIASLLQIQSVAVSVAAAVVALVVVFVAVLCCKSVMSYVWDGMVDIRMCAISLVVRMWFERVQQGVSLSPHLRLPLGLAATAFVWCFAFRFHQTVYVGSGQPID